MKQFENLHIILQLPGCTHVELFQVTHIVELPGQTVGLLNNGDNFWSQLKADLSQEWINALGQAIEDKIRDRR